MSKKIFQKSSVEKAQDAVRNRVAQEMKERMLPFNDHLVRYSAPVLTVGQGKMCSVSDSVGSFST